jgi:uncharacterized protein (DUF58 family)
MIDTGARIRFDGPLRRRLERFAARWVAHERRREGAGRAPLAGVGTDPDGLRPYRIGDDPRLVDWGLLARLDRVYVRTTRREAGETWGIAIDTSASMAIGEPSKLQAAGECAAALLALGLRFGAAVELGALVAGRPAVRRFDHPRAWVDALAFLEELEAAGAEGPRQLLPRLGAASVGRRYVVGDLFDLEPAQVLPLARVGHPLALVQVTARFERLPLERGPLTVLDPEGPGRLQVDLTADLAARYERRVAALGESWRRAAARRGARHALVAAEDNFEERLRPLLAP